MKVSVVIPAHNEEKNISGTIRSLLAQDYPDFEIIVIDNASTDRTAQVAGAFPVKVVREDKKGLLWARDRGRREATGEIIANIDADCEPEPDWISRAIRYFDDRKTVAVTGPYDYHDGDQAFRKISLFTQRNVYYAVTHMLQLPFVRGGAVLIGGNNFIRAEALQKAGGYNTSLTFYGEDTDTAKRVAVYGKVRLVRSLLMKTSARRFKSEGTLRLTLRYFYYFFSTLVRARPAQPSSLH
jgi:glycosyltransferase involved in cell wall biosynthesis